MAVEIFTLPNGIRVVAEEIDHVRSVSIGCWFGAGARREVPENNGISHFIEHMMFKGTKTKNAKELAETMDNIGGQLNAFTGKETTCYYTKVLDTHLEEGIGILSEMLLESTFTEENIDLERNVILEEVNMYEDSPEDVVYDLLMAKAWEGKALGMPVLGTKESLLNIHRAEILDYLSRYYVPENMVISVVGYFKTDRLIALLEKYFGGFSTSSNQEILTFAHEPLEYGTAVRNKEIEQVHLMMGFPSTWEEGQDYYIRQVMNTVFGGSMSSRIFQKIREELGLAYSVYSQNVRYQNTGALFIGAGYSPEYHEKFLRALWEEIDIFCDKGITETELQRAREQLKSNSIMSMEGTNARMQYYGKKVLLNEHIRSIDELVKMVDQITPADVIEASRQIFSSRECALALVGPKSFEAETK